MNHFSSTTVSPPLAYAISVWHATTIFYLLVPLYTVSLPLAYAWHATTIFYLLVPLYTVSLPLAYAIIQWEIVELLCIPQRSSYLHYCMNQQLKYLRGFVGTLP